MIRWVLKRVKIVHPIDGQTYVKDIRVLEYLEHPGKWIEVPEVDERGVQP